MRVWWGKGVFWFLYYEYCTGGVVLLECVFWGESLVYKCCEAVVIAMLV